MSYIPKTISEVVTEFINRTTFLPAIQREYVWSTYAIEKLFDSILADYPISTFLFWKIREENKNEWVAYQFISDFDSEDSHNIEANLAGVNQDIYLVLDGQQRLTSLLIGLKGTYSYFYYRPYKTKLYLNILKAPKEPENPEELTFQFQFRENDLPNSKDPSPQFWYLVGDILNYEDAEDAKKAVKKRLADFSEEHRDTANVLIGKLHSRIHTSRLLNYYEEKSQDYNKVVEAFIRVNTGGIKLEYSDILLSTATAKWAKLNARHEIHSFTDSINAIGTGYTFGKDFVLKGCLYLTDNLPIQYKVKNFTKTNLERIESNWDTIKSSIESAVRLVSKFGFSDKNLVAKIALLPVALYLQKLNSKHFVSSTEKSDVENQSLIQKWIIINLLRNAFGSSTDTTLKILQETINAQADYSKFPIAELLAALKIEATFSDIDIENLLKTNYGTKYSYLILSLLYPDRDWKDNVYNEDHIFPKSEFTEAKLKQRGYSSDQTKDYLANYNSIANLQLLTESENKSKSATDFAEWLSTRDAHFKQRHQIPELTSYSFDEFMDFVRERKKLIKHKISPTVGKTQTAQEVIVS